MGIYDPSIAIKHNGGQKYDITVKTVVGNGEGLELIKNNPPPAGGDTRLILFNVVAGPGGTIKKVVPVTRAQGETTVEVKVDKNGQTEGQGSQEYE